jgi:hypothetical protein
MRWVFIILYCGEPRGANGEAPVIAGYFESVQRLDSFRSDGIQNRFLTEKVESITDGDVSPVSVRYREIFGMVFGFFFGHLEPVVAGDAGDQQLPIVFFRDAQISGRKGEGQGFIRTVGGTCTATGPIFELMESDLEKA